MKRGSEALTEYSELESRLGYRFREPALLREALTHASRRMAESDADNERLEFLGDRVLGLVVAEALLERFPDAREGALAPRLNALVRKETLAEIGDALGLSAFIRFAKGEDLEVSRSRGAVLADACEAVIAAVYKDGGLEAARALILTALGERFAALATVPRDAKTALQEWAQGRGLATPVYRLVGREGPDHAPHFKVLASVEGLQPQAGEGASKRAAEQAAAAALLLWEKMI